MATFVLLHPAPVARDRFLRGVHLDAASGARHRVLYVDAVVHASRALASATTPIAVLDPYVSGDLDLSAVMRIRRTLPSSGVIAYGEFRKRPAQDLVELSRSGIDAALSFDVDDDASGVRRAILGAMDRRHFGHFLEAAAPVVSSRAFPVIQASLRRGDRRSSVAQLAGDLGLSDRALQRLAAEEKLPPPARVMSWARVAHAAHLLCDPGRTVENVAQALDFPDAPTLRKLIKRETGLRPRELVAQGSVESAASRFAAFLTCNSAPRLGVTQREHGGLGRTARELLSD